MGAGGIRHSAVRPPARPHEADRTGGRERGADYPFVLRTPTAPHAKAVRVAGRGATDALTVAADSGGAQWTRPWGVASLAVEADAHLDSGRAHSTPVHNAVLRLALVAIRLSANVRPIVIALSLTQPASDRVLRRIIALEAVTRTAIGCCSAEENRESSR